MEQPVRLESFKTVTPEGPNQEPILRSWVTVPALQKFKTPSIA
jgi:hypothetical protein